MAPLSRIEVGIAQSETATNAARPVTGDGISADKSAPQPHEYELPPSPAEAFAEIQAEGIHAMAVDPGHMIIDNELSRSIDEHFPFHRSVTPYDGLRQLEEGMKEGRYPRPEVIGRLLNSLGRLKQIDTAKRLYGIAQAVLLSPVMEANKQEQSLAWFQIEDQMVIALAHGGDVDAAHHHRIRILEQGGAPSSDAYAVLIAAIKDTTDDVNYALVLWDEAQSRGVIPNMFLYNTVISRLARGRKAEQALELFHRMKSERISPSTVTYGAIITACARVADVASAEALFDEMTKARRYFPRVPPFNTIMQLFVHIKPDREKALSYYERMKKAGLKPTDHTYKLLLDAYGSIQPVDLASMEKVFKALQADRRVTVNGSHWASRIVAYGSVQRNLEKAMAIFDEIPVSDKLPDALCFEAMCNVLITHHRPDLFQVYLDRMVQQGVRITAYINNLLIKGYAAVGDIADARKVFESMDDPPFGVAASNNHRAPHESVPNNTSTDAPVYREPSSWEAMVRAELGQKHKQEAIALLERMRTRGYPPAVLYRVEGILQDDSPSSDPTVVSSDTGSNLWSQSSSPPSSVH